MIHDLSDDESQSQSQPLQTSATDVRMASDTAATSNDTANAMEVEAELDMEADTHDGANAADAGADGKASATTTVAADGGDAEIVDLRDTFESSEQDQNGESMDTMFSSTASMKSAATASENGEESMATTGDSCIHHRCC